jgi:nitrogen PTS system EIIA component
LKPIAELLPARDIILDLEVANKDQLFDAIGRHMEATHGLPKEWVVLSLSRREQVGSTGLGQGVAIPHARIKDLLCIQLAYLRLKEPIPFGAPDGKPVSDILVLLVPKPATEEHLAILAEASRLFSDANFREHLHQCKQPAVVRQLFVDWPVTA